jgi:hypothetical protein
VKGDEGVGLNSMQSEGQICTHFKKLIKVNEKRHRDKSPHSFPRN